MIVFTIVVDLRLFENTSYDRVHACKLKYGEFKRLNGRKKLE